MSEMSQVWAYACASFSSCLHSSNCTTPTIFTLQIYLQACEQLLREAAYDDIASLKGMALIINKQLCIVCRMQCLS